MARLSKRGAQGSGLSRSPEALERERFVDALREFLGLEPLYTRSRYRSEAERFAPKPAVGVPAQPKGT